MLSCAAGYSLLLVVHLVLKALGVFDIAFIGQREGTSPELGPESACEAAVAPAPASKAKEHTTVANDASAATDAYPSIVWIIIWLVLSLL